MSLEAWGDGGDQDDSFTQERVDEIVAEAVAEALAAKWRPIDTAPKDSSAILGYGRHDRSPADAQRGVKAGDHWWSIMLWDIWRTPTGGWVFAKDGHPVWSPPTHWMPLPEPPP